MGDAKTVEGVCKNGHVRTEQNTSFVKDSSRNRVRIRCLACKRANKPEVYTGKGSKHSGDLKYDAMLDRHDDIEDLIEFGVAFKEIVERSSYANWFQMRRSLKKGDRQDLIDKLEARRAAERNRGQAFMVNERGLSFEIARRPSKTFKVDGAS